MTDTLFGPQKERQRGNWIRLRTMTMLRWGAIVGQLSALFIAQYLYDLWLPLGLCVLVVGVSIAGNLVAAVVFPQNKRLYETENLLLLLFDLLQLGLLLYLTGGLHNPFSILIVGPVTVSAAALGLRSTLFVGATAIVLVSLLLEFHIPLRTSQGFLLQIPDVFLFGSWAATTIAVVFLGIYSRWIITEMNTMSDALQATQMALAREQKLTDLGGVVAATAHELGTPLATIKLASSELIDDLSAHPEMREDAVLIQQQADRCRDILRSMGRLGKDDLYMRQAPITAVVDEAAEPHRDRGRAFHFDDHPLQSDDQEVPMVLRKPEVIHGLRNLVQNAVDFAKANVWVETTWSPEFIKVRIVDDGKGFPPHVIGRIGYPFARSRRTETERTNRSEYEGMGLGLFIAKTLLERSGAELSFANAPQPDQENRGAIVEVVWPRELIDSQTGDNAIPISRNLPFIA